MTRVSDAHRSPTSGPSQTFQGTRRSHQGCATPWHQNGRLNFQAKWPHSHREQWSEQRRCAPESPRGLSPTLALARKFGGASPASREQTCSAPPACVSQTSCTPGLGGATARERCVRAPGGVARVGEGREKSRDFLVDRVDGEEGARRFGSRKVQGDKEEPHSARRRSPLPSPPPAGGPPGRGV